MRHMGKNYCQITGPATASQTSVPAAVCRTALQPARLTSWWAGSAAAALMLAGSTCPTASAAQDFRSAYRDGHLEACVQGTSCVSTSSFMSPSMYLPPFSFDPTPQPAAIRSLVEELQAQGGELLQVDLEQGYVAAQVPYTVAGQRDVDDVEFKFIDGNKVLFHSQAHHGAPSPPFCWWKGCISGPGNRARLESLRDLLGWNSAEPDEGKEWQGILLH